MLPSYTVDRVRLRVRLGACLCGGRRRPCPGFYRAGEGIGWQDLVTVRRAMEVAAMIRTMNNPAIATWATGRVGGRGT